MRSSIAALPLGALMFLVPVGAIAQTTIEGRVGRIEQELRAVQRKVFPEGAGKFLQPQVTAPTVEGPTPGTPAASQVTDLDARVSAVEAQMRTLTGQVEQNSFKTRQLEQQFAELKASLAAAAAPTPAPALPEVPVAATPAPAAATPKPATPKPAAAATPKPAAPAGASEARKTAVAAVERPDTGNEAEDGYTYGFRLWTAKFYPEAQVQLKTTVEKFGTGSVGSRSQNLLGRAYLDDGKYALASVAFYENYQKRPKGERAADSLAYLGEALIQLGKLPDACKVFQEFGDVYGATARADLKAMVEKGKARAKCGA